MQITDGDVPQARSEGLIVQNIADEVLVYDLDRHRSHCLNRMAALVWRHCDGKTTVHEMAIRLRRELNVPADEEAVWLALERLDKAHLLQERLTRPEQSHRTSRRALVRQLAGIGALALVTLIVAPTPAQAATVINPSVCTNDRPENEGKCCTNNKICHLTSTGGGCDGPSCSGALSQPRSGPRPPRPPRFGR